MEIKVIRKTFSKDTTIGELYINGKFFCYTLEDFDRDKNKDGDLNDSGETKVYGETAIPRGKYTLVLSMSNRFKEYLPEILNVVGFIGVRIHAGNSKADTHGCILVGKSKGVNFIGNSRQAMKELMAELERVEKKEKITIEIV